MAAQQHPGRRDLVTAFMEAWGPATVPEVSGDVTWLPGSQAMCDAIIEDTNTEYERRLVAGGLSELAEEREMLRTAELLDRPRLAARGERLLVLSFVAAWEEDDVEVLSCNDLDGLIATLEAQGVEEQEDDERDEVVPW
jgi:hypothetical protein